MHKTGEHAEVNCLQASLLDRERESDINYVKKIPSDSCWEDSNCCPLTHEPPYITTRPLDPVSYVLKKVQYFALLANQFYTYQ